KLALVETERTGDKRCLDFTSAGIDFLNRLAGEDVVNNVRCDSFYQALYVGCCCEVAFPKV
ncbi:MAG: hypothetical protein LBP37_00695, partial [Spirochaetaceae bacterium]|nr:hypothetical protein [Spirochaetaceae bacterium]